MANHYAVAAIALLVIIFPYFSYADLSLTGYSEDPPVQIRIMGFLECSAPPDRPVQSPPIAGANVIYVCGSERAAVADTVTTDSGLYMLNVFKDNVWTTLFDPTKQCRIVVRLPVARCAVFPPEGTLEAVPHRLIGTQIDELLGGRVDNYEASPFQYYPPPRY